MLALSVYDKFRLTSQKIFIGSAPDGDIKEAVPRASTCFSEHFEIIAMIHRIMRYRTFRDLKFTVAHYETVFTIPRIYNHLSRLHAYTFSSIFVPEYLRFYESQ